MHGDEVDERHVQEDADAECESLADEDESLVAASSLGNLSVVGDYFTCTSCVCLTLILITLQILLVHWGC